MAGWAALGKPDFSRAAQLVYRLPAELRNQFNKSDQEVLTWALFLTWWSQTQSGRTAPIASFSEAWLGGKFGKSRWTVGRALAKLEGLSLLKRIRRNPKPDGFFRTNLIALSARLTAIICPNSRQVLDFSPCSKTAPQEVENVYKTGLRASLSGALTRILSKEEKKDVRIVGPYREIVFVDG